MKSKKISVRALRLLAGLGLILIWVSSGGAYDHYADLYFNPRLSAGSLGAGALQGTQEGADAIFGNVANLQVLRHTDVKMGLGIFPQGGLATTFSYAQPLPGIGKFGLGISLLMPAGETDSDEFATSLAMREQAVLLGYSHAIMPGFFAGLRIRALRVEHDGRASAGESIDLGMRLKFTPVVWGGLTAYNILQPQIRTSLEEVAYPRKLQLTLGTVWENIVKAGLEFTQELEKEMTYRAALGLESDFSRQWFIRGGADTEAFYAGTGYHAEGWGLDYAWRSDFQVKEMHHRIGLHLKFGAYHAGLDSSSKYLTKGGMKPRVKFSFDFTRNVLLEKWKLIIRDSRGKMVKYFAGRNKLPESIVWEGRDQKSRIVADGRYRCVLDGYDYEGNQLRSNAVEIRVVSSQSPEFIQVK